MASQQWMPWARRGLQVDRICARCGEQAETVVHMALLCIESQCLWRLSPLRLDITSWNQDIKEWCAMILNKWTEKGAWELVMMLV